MLRGMYVSWEPWMARQLCGFTSAEKRLRCALVCCWYPKTIRKAFRDVPATSPAWTVSYCFPFLTCISTVHLPDASLSKLVRLSQLKATRIVW